MADRPQRPMSSRRRLATLALPALVLLAAAVAHVAIAAHADRAQRERLDRRAHQVASAVEHRVRTYGDVLYSVHGLFSSSAHVTPGEFHVNLASQRIFERHPGVQVVGFAEWTARHEAAALAARVDREARAAGLGYPPFAISPPADR